MKIGFYGPEFTGSTTNAFCCMTYGFTNTPVETAEYRIRSNDPEAESVIGSYEECLALAEKLAGSVKAAIVITNNRGGENAFIKKLSAILKCPVVGGGAPISSNPEVPGLPVPAAQAQILCVTDPDIQAEAVFENIHDEILEECDLEYENPRILNRVNGIPAAEFLQKKRAELGLGSTDFEHLTFSTPEHINAHLAMDDNGNITSGRDLEPGMLLRFVAPEKVQQRMEDFYNDPDALVFGCAGLRGIMEHTHEATGFGGYFFGEICTVNGHSDFGNLMLSKLRITKK